jgi:hypothetical protein
MGAAARCEGQRAESCSCRQCCSPDCCRCVCLGMHMCMYAMGSRQGDAETETYGAWSYERKRQHLLALRGRCRGRGRCSGAGVVASLGSTELSGLAPAVDPCLVASPSECHRQEAVRSHYTLVQIRPDSCNTDYPYTMVSVGITSLLID